MRRRSRSGATVSRGASVQGFDYRQGSAFTLPAADFQNLERQGFRRQVDGAKGETWYRSPSTGRLAVEVYAIIPAATNKVTP